MVFCSRFGRLCGVASSRSEKIIIAIHTDIPYKSGELSSSERALCKLDIYAPARAANLPVLVFFHGGGLTEGDKADAWIAPLASEGLVIASANYRLYPDDLFPTFAEDAAAAVAWMRAHAREYGGGDSLFIAGHSAGAYIAALLGTDARYLNAHGIALADIAGVIALSGQMITHFAVRAQDGWPDTAIRVDEAAPLYHVAGDKPPFLLGFGESDMAMRPEENRLMAAALRNAGNADVECLELAGRDHDTISRMTSADDILRREIISWIGARA